MNFTMKKTSQKIWSEIDKRRKSGDKTVTWSELVRKTKLSRSFFYALRDGRASEPSKSNIEKVAKALNCDPNEIWGTSQNHNCLPVIKQPANYKAVPHSGTVSIPEYLITASAGHGLTIPDLEDAECIWEVPVGLISRLPVSSHNKLAIFTIAGNSMSPKYVPGDRVLIDLSSDRFTHDADYVFRTDDILMIKQLQLIPKATGAVIRAISLNEEFIAWELPVKELNIVGRVAGKWVFE
ncbi:LexA family transcriptional regulator [Acetobacteraceae bacterium]|nr:LexA family transcriptional regulator [Acetobacteraceae bacterium]